MKSHHVITLTAATLLLAVWAAWQLFEGGESGRAVARAESRAPAVSPRPLAVSNPAHALPGGEATFTEDGLRKPRRTAPPPAVTRAATEPDPVRRVETITTALREWARRDMEAAGAWAVGQAPIPRGIAMAAVIAGAVEHDPEGATGLVERASAQDPERAAEYGRHLIFALGEAGEYQRAAAWAQSGDDIAALDWMTAAYDRWAAHEPEVALLSAVAVPDSLRRRAAVEAAVGAWARIQPEALAESALGFPPGPERKLALVTALRSWLERAPGVAEEWIQAHREHLAGLSQLETILEE